MDASRPVRRADPLFRDIQEGGGEPAHAVNLDEGMQHHEEEYAERMREELRPRLRRLLNPPRGFDGSNPRQWLIQMTHYYDALEMTEYERVADAPSFLTGQALCYWCSIVEDAPEMLPSTWEEFRNLILNRFSEGSVALTIARIKQIKYQGDFDEVVRRFAEVLETGQRPPPDVVKELFLSRFPLDMVKGALDKRITTWVQAREYLRRLRGAKQTCAMHWYELAPPEFRARAEQDERIVEEGWIPTPLKVGGMQSGNKSWNESKRHGEEARKGGNRQGESGRPAWGNNSKGHQQSYKQQENRQRDADSKIRCYSCNGSGHIARNCPNMQLEAKRNGQRCNRCGGIGHWASSCPTPPSKGVKQPAAQTKREDVTLVQQGNGQA